MVKNMELPKRKPTRLKGYDYSQNGAYFITICTHNRRYLFSNIVGAIHELPVCRNRNCAYIYARVILLWISYFSFWCTFLQKKVPKGSVARSLFSSFSSQKKRTVFVATVHLCMHNACCDNRVKRPMLLLRRAFPKNAQRPADAGLYHRFHVIII